MKTRKITIHGQPATDEEIKAVMTKIRQNAETTLDKYELAERYGLNCSYTSLRMYCDEHCIDYPQIRRRRARMAETESKTQQIIPLKKSGKTVRKTVTVSESVSERWDEVMADIPLKSVPLDKALTDFLDAYEAGEIAFVLGR